MNGIIAETIKKVIELFNTPVMGKATLFDVAFLTAFYGNFAIIFIKKVVERHKPRGKK